MYARQASCLSSFALAVADFEPRMEGVEFETANTSTVQGRSAAEVAEPYLLTTAVFNDSAPANALIRGRPASGR